ncbi:zinc ribbon domain-containing protein [Candidatus Pacearchaeota archaeon]|nr:zinc ribbon domain-containing protein [Candidatus Pacearchaeota archaeon]
MSIFHKKIKCRCGKKVRKDYLFCPWCGTDLKFQIKHKEEFEKQIKPLTDTLPFPLKNMFNSLADELERGFRDFDKELEKELEQAQKEQEKVEKELGKNPSINISIRKISNGQPVIQVQQIGKAPEKEIKLPTARERILTKNEEDKYSKLPRKEPVTKVRRFSDRILYELSMPEVKDQKDLIINKLQDSIEIKAFTEKRVYSKVIPVSLPIKSYKLEKGKLILELKVQ